MNQNIIEKGKRDRRNVPLLIFFLATTILLAVVSYFDNKTIKQQDSQIRELSSALDSIVKVIDRTSKK